MQEQQHHRKLFAFLFAIRGGESLKPVGAKNSKKPPEIRLNWSAQLRIKPKKPISSIDKFHKSKCMYASDGYHTISWYVSITSLKI